MLNKKNNKNVSEQKVIKSNNKQQEIIKHLGDTLRNSLKIPVIEIDPSFIKNIYDLVIEEAPELLKYFQKNELHHEVSHFISNLIFMSNRSEKEINKSLMFCMFD